RHACGRACRRGRAGDRLGRHRRARPRARRRCARRGGRHHRARALHGCGPARRRARRHTGRLMLARRIIPCLDVKDGRVVKGVRFVDLADAGDPVEAAARYDAEGADELTFLDITASHEERPIILDVVARTAERVFMPLTVGGGVRTVDAVEWAARMEAAGAGEILLTSMDRDGTRLGYDLELTRAVADRVGIPVIASGGAGTLEHLYDGLTTGGASAALVASLFHYGEHTVREAKAYLRGRGVAVRP